MKVSDLVAFENRMREERGWKRKDFCTHLGISQGKLRRMVEDRPEAEELNDRTLALACAAVAGNLPALGDAPAE